MSKKGKTNRIDYVLGVLDKFSKPLKKFNDRMDDTLRPARKVKHALAAIGKESGFGRIAKQAGRVRKELGGIASIAGTIGGVMVAGLAGAGYALNRTAQEMAQLRSQAQSVGMNPLALMAWDGAVKELGFDYEKVVDLVEEMNNKIGESKGLEQTTPVKEAMQMLRLDFEKISKLKPEEQFERIMSAAAGMADQQMAVSAVDILMGGEANKIMGHMRAVAQEEGKSVEEVLAHYKRLNLLTGEGMERFKHFGRAGNDLFTVIGSGFRELMSHLGYKLVPLMKQATEWIIDNFDDIKDRVATMLDGFDPQEFLADLREVWSVFKSVWSVVSTVVDVLGGLRGVMILLGALIATKLVLALGGLATAFYSLGVAIMTTPVGWIMGAIALLAIAAVALIRNWDAVKSFFTGLFDWLGNKFAWVAEMAGKVGGLLGFGGGDQLAQPAGGHGASGSWGQAANRAGQINETRFSSETVSRSESRLSVDFNNMPPGTRVSREGDTDMDVSQGWVMATDFG